MAAARSGDRRTVLGERRPVRRRRSRAAARPRAPSGGPRRGDGTGGRPASACPPGRRRRSGRCGPPRGAGRGRAPASPRSRAPATSPAARRASATADERVLVQVREPLAVGGEALVPEALGEVAAVQRRARGPTLAGRRRRALRTRPRRCRARAPAAGRACPGRPRARVGLDARRGEARPDEPQRLAQRRRRRAVEVGPEVGGDRVAESGAGAEGQQRGERLGVASGESNRLTAGDDLEPSEEAN